MRSVIWILRIIAFLLLLGFAIKNDGLVTLNFFLGLSWQLPIAFVLLMSFVAGAVVALSASLASHFAQRRELARLQAHQSHPTE